MLFSHAMIGTNDVEKAKAFYDKVLGALGISPGTCVNQAMAVETRAEADWIAAIAEDEGWAEVHPPEAVSRDAVRVAQRFKRTTGT